MLLLSAVKLLFFPACWNLLEPLSLLLERREELEVVVVVDLVDVFAEELTLMSRPGMTGSFVDSFA